MRLWNKYKSLPVQVKASIWYTICNFFQKGISFIVVPIYVRLLTTAEYGEWSVFQSWRDILIIFASLNLYAGVYTKTIVDNVEDRDRYTSSMQGLGTVISIIMLTIYYFMHDWCNKRIGLTTPYVLLLFLYFIVYPAFSFWGTRQRVEYKYMFTILVTALISILTPVVSIALIRLTNLRAKAMILGYLLVQCCVGLVFYIYQFCKGKCFYHKDYWKYALEFNIPLIPHYLSLIVLGQSDRIMIQRFCGDSDAGIYSFAYQIASAMSMFLSAINGSRVPWSYEQLKMRVYQQLKKISNALCIMIGAIALMAALLAPDIISILGTEDYKLATYVIPIVCLSVYFTFVYDLFCSVEFYYGETKYIMLASVLGAISNVVLNEVFIPIGGFIAAAYTTLASYVLFMFMHFLFMRKVMNNQGIEGEIYDTKFLGLFSVLLTITVFMSLLTYKNNMVRWMLIMVLYIALFIFRNKIINVIKSMR